MPKYIIILLIILAIGIFLRVYQIEERFDFAYDGDVASWVVRNIVVDKHVRLIGQQISAPGIYIGSLFYYLLIPFYLLSGMDPIGGAYLMVVIATLTVISYYFVFSKLFNRYVGLIAAFLQAVLLDRVYYDRWAVPSTLTGFWSIWYFYCLINVVRGNWTVLPILAVLIGLIWHIHIALFPALLAVPVSVILSGKFPPKKWVLVFVGVLVLTNLPLGLFELKHNFLQTRSFWENLFSDHQYGNGLYKLSVVLGMLYSNLANLLQLPFKVGRQWLFVAILLSSVWLIKAEVIKFGESLLLLVWVVSMVGFFTLTSSPISEYYFSNVEVIFIGLIALILYLVAKSFRNGFFLLSFLGLLLAFGNVRYFINHDIYRVGLHERKALVEFIKKDAQGRNFHCISVSYVTSVGDNFGFRYLFWLNQLKLADPRSGLPVYTIVQPEALVKSPEKTVFGHVGVVLPEKQFGKNSYLKSCRSEDFNLTQPFVGFTQ